MTLLVERIMHSVLPFRGEVYVQDIRKSMPWERKNASDDKLSNSRPLSHWTDLMVLCVYSPSGVVRPNCVDTRAMGSLYIFPFLYMYIFRPRVLVSIQLLLITFLMFDFFLFSFH
jgi:hypothetical protein